MPAFADAEHMETSSTLKSTDSSTSGAKITSATNSIADATTGSAPLDNASSENLNHRFLVSYMGPTAGDVAFLGFMRDPSVAWIFTGCLIIIFGTLAAFLLIYRESWAWYDETNKMLYLGVAVRGTSPLVHRKFDRFIERVRLLSDNLETPPIDDPDVAVAK
jgi:hypothetical protein